MPLVERDFRRDEKISRYLCSAGTYILSLSASQIRYVHTVTKQYSVSIYLGVLGSDPSRRMDILLGSIPN